MILKISYELNSPCNTKNWNKRDSDTPKIILTLKKWKLYLYFSFWWQSKLNGPYTWLKKVGWGTGQSKIWDALNRRIYHKKRLTIIISPNADSYFSWLKCPLLNSILKKLQIVMFGDGDAIGHQMFQCICDRNGTNFRITITIYIYN